VLAVTIALAVAAAAAALYAYRARRAASAAAAARTRYEVLAANLPDVSVMLYDRDLRITLLEGSALQAHGWHRRDIEGQLIADVLLPERAQQLLACCHAALRGESSGHDWASERGGIHYRGEHVPLRDARGAVTGGMIVVRDVTEAQRLQRERDNERGFLAAMVEQLSDHVVACDASGKLLLVNEAARRPAGGPVDPLDWPQHFGLFRPDGHTPLPAAEVPLFRALQGEVIRDVDVAVEAPGTGLRRMLVSGRPVMDAHGRTLGAVVSGVDVTHERATEERLRASEERYRSVVESVGDTVFQTDLRGRWTFLNESWARWTGTPVADALGRQASELVHPDDRAKHARAFAPLLAGEVDSVHLSHRYLTADDVTRIGEVRASLARDAAGRPLCVVGVIEDITEHHRTQQYEAAEQAVVEVLGATIDVEQGVPVLLAALCRNLEWDLAELWTLDTEREVLHCTDAWGERRAGLEALEATRDGETFEVGDGLQGQAWARRAPIWASGLEDDPLFHRGAAAEAAGVRSALAMPIARGGELLAVILFFSREQRDPDAGLSRLLQTIGAHLAQFLERRRAERALAESVAEVDELSRLVVSLRRV
jgi:PAS domain S-box-containing protein